MSASTATATTTNATTTARSTSTATFRPFALEEWQSRYEQEVRWNIADSGVQPVILSELLGDDPDALARLLALDLHYPPVNGTPLLRERIAALYPGITPDQVLVTVGAAEANGIATTTLTQPGDHVVVLEPGYRQVAGVAANHGCEVDAFHLIEERGWRPDLAELARVVRPDTRLIAVSNPNNPTGAILTPEEIAEIIRIAASVGAWVLADEVYRGTEVDTDEETPSFAGQYDRLVLTNSLSKAYGLSGLRVGWTIADEETMQAMWRRHEYATIATSNVSMALAELAVEPVIRGRLFARNRALIREGLARLNAWVDSTAGLVTLTPPHATALAFIRYDHNLAMPSLAVAHELRKDGVLVGVGADFGEEYHLRVTHGLSAAIMDAALAQMTATFTRLAG